MITSDTLLERNPDLVTAPMGGELAMMFLCTLHDEQLVRVAQ